MRFQKVYLENILSFRNALLPDLGSVNILIGPNASGKSNLLDALSLLQAVPTNNLAGPISRGGGIQEWLWRGQGSNTGIATIECDLEVEKSRVPLHYLLSIQEANPFTIREERLIPLTRGANSARPFFDRHNGRIVFSGRVNEIGDQIPSAESALSSFRDPTKKRELTAVGKGFEAIRIYRNFDTSLGPGGGARHGVSTSYLPVSGLAEDGFNLALILSRMRINGSIQRVESYLSQFVERFGEVHVDPTGGMARLYIREQGLQRPTPGLRLSDGTLKLLCLLVVLFNSESESSLVCIDEPETGLHPDAVRLLARAITEASPRMQLIIATHSDALVDEFSDTPEAVVVCENDARNGTAFKRLSRKKLKAWLQDYSLGELWRKGAIGGNPW
ncbi:MAG TPA: AAA family ATPase [Bryobacteraceae bacterium]|nr:AAA family ATPase [Bryobacteraceae bacterium]